MAVGGYKSVSFSWQGGRTDTPVERTKFVLNGICDAIIGANVGWQYDTLTPTSADFLQMPSTNHTNEPVLLKVIKLEYNSHTYRLCIGNVYDYGTLGSSAKLKPSDCSNTYGTEYNLSSQNGMFDGTMFFGIIRDGSLTTDSTYSYVWDGQGVFTKWIAFSAARNSNHSIICENSSQYVYSYYFVLKNAQIGIFQRSSSWTYNCRLRGFLAGEIFKQTGHTTDTNGIGVCSLSDSGYAEINCPQSRMMNADAGYITFQDRTGNNVSPIQSSIITASGIAYAGDLISENYKTVYDLCVCFDDIVIGNYVSSTITSPGGRWTPCWMAIRAADHDTYGVVPGDGFKGYVDTDLLRGVNPNYGYGQQLDGGNFVYLGGGFAIGWDTNNTILLF